MLLLLLLFLSEYSLARSRKPVVIRVTCASFALATSYLLCINIRTKVVFIQIKIKIETQ
jgi:hypothetical protein